MSPRWRLTPPTPAELVERAVRELIAAGTSPAEAAQSMTEVAWDTAFEGPF